MVQNEISFSQFNVTNRFNFILFGYLHKRLHKACMVVKWLKTHCNENHAFGVSNMFMQYFLMIDDIY